MKKTMAIQITERDIEILSFINQFGFCEIRHIQKQFQLKKPRSYKVMKRLITSGLLKHQSIFYKQHGVYFVTEAGASYTDFPALKKISYRHYRHHLKVIEVAMRLTRAHSDATWISERLLLQEARKKHKGKRRHLADGLLLLPDDKKIAIEVELSRKAPRRLAGILKHYATQEVEEVWYYCDASIFAYVSIMAKSLPFIKIFNIEALLT